MGTSPAVAVRWRLSWRADPAALPLANRHYPRQSHGSAQFVAPGACVVLVAGEPVNALWVSLFQEHADHAWPGAWICAAFRNEGAGLSSELIREAIAATVERWGPPPPRGMVTFVDRDAVRPKRDPGRCFLRAGFVVVGETERRKRLVLQLLPAGFPAPSCAVGASPRLFGAA